MPLRRVLGIVTPKKECFDILTAKLQEIGAIHSCVSRCKGAKTGRCIGGSPLLSVLDPRPITLAVIKAVFPSR